MLSRAACGLEDERVRVDVWMPVNFGLVSSLGHVTWAGAAAAMRARLLEKGRHNGNIEVRGGDMAIEDEIHTCMFKLVILHTSEGWNRLLDVLLGAIV